MKTKNAINQCCVCVCVQQRAVSALSLSGLSAAAEGGGATGGEGL